MGDCLSLSLYLTQGSALYPKYRISSNKRRRRPSPTSKRRTFGYPH